MSATEAEIRVGDRVEDGRSLCRRGTVMKLTPDGSRVLVKWDGYVFAQTYYAVRNLRKVNESASAAAHLVS